MVRDHQNAKGFTLVELIVVMAIIAVLVTLSVLGITTVQRSARDTARIETLSAINLEIENYNGNNGSYPTTMTLNASNTLMTIGGSNTNTVTLSGAAIADVATTTGTAGTGTSQTKTDYCYKGYTSTYSLGAMLESGQGKFFGTGTACSLTGTTLVTP